MRDSYLILDEYVSCLYFCGITILFGYSGPHSRTSPEVPKPSNPYTYGFVVSQMRFLDCTQGRKDPSKSILDVGVETAIQFSGFDEKMFLKRGGKYVWSKAEMKLEW